MTNYTIEKLATNLKALSEPNRLRIWMAVQNSELCLCHLTEMLDLAASTVSKHTDILQKSGWITARKQGRWTFFKAVQNQQLASWLSLQKVDLTTEFKQDLKFIHKIQNEECC